MDNNDVDNDQSQETFVFLSDEIESTHARKDKNNYFVNVIKNPFLRWLLRIKKTEEEPAPAPKKPLPVAPRAPKKPKPQFRTTIRVTTLKLETAQKKHKKTVTALSILLGVFILISIFLAINALNPCIFSQCRV